MRRDLSTIAGVLCAYLLGLLAIIGAFLVIVLVIRLGAGVAAALGQLFALALGGQL